MARTTLNLDDPILDDLKRLQKKEGKSLGELASEVLAEGLAARREGKRTRGHEFRWKSRSMKARVDLEDKDAINAILDGD
ncbi:MAG: hypothetical protein ACRD16_01035 [Thermoanaerobaculia bacterium]